MDLQLKHKVVLVTGGAKGIGAAISRTCAQEGAIAVAVDRDVSAGEKLRDELSVRFVLVMDRQPLKYIIGHSGLCTE